MGKYGVPHSRRDLGVDITCLRVLIKLVFGDKIRYKMAAVIVFVTEN